METEDFELLIALREFSISNLHIIRLQYFLTRILEIILWPIKNYLQIEYEAFSECIQDISLNVQKEEAKEYAAQMSFFNITRIETSEQIFSFSVKGLRSYMQT